MLSRFLGPRYRELAKNWCHTLMPRKLLNLVENTEEARHCGSLHHPGEPLK